MVDNIGAVGGAMGNVPARKLQKAYQMPQNQAKLQDAVELSDDVMTVRTNDQLRMEKIAEIRNQIKAGTYLTDQKLDRALDRALAEAIS